MVKLAGTYRNLIKDTNINDVTLLSTDYLNHYNELVMILEMVPEMPDMMKEVLEWVPKSYQEHFRDSIFQYKDLAVWAYENAPEQYRVPLDDCIARCDAEILDGLPVLSRLIEAEASEALHLAAANLIAALRRYIDMMSALINGAMAAERYFAQIESEFDSDHGEAIMDQSGIDALFD